MESNAGKYSMAGVAEAAYTAVTGRQVSAAADAIAQTFGGNEITGAYFGLFGSSNSSAKGAYETMAGKTNTIASGAVGQSLSYGRRTSDIMALNIAGETGLPRALSTASRFRSALGTAAKWFSLGLSETQRLVIDGTFTAAEALACAASR